MANDRCSGCARPFNDRLAIDEATAKVSGCGSAHVLLEPGDRCQDCSYVAPLHVYGRSPAMASLQEVNAANEAAKVQLRDATNAEVARHVIEGLTKLAQDDRDGSGSTAEDRKLVPIASGFLAYFPDAVRAVARLSQIGNDQHNPGKPLHWDRSKSGDEADALSRHFLERGTRDTDGVRHSAKVAWRALALLQKEIEADRC